MSKLIRNPNRNKNHQKIDTTPQYKILGISPEIKESEILPPNTNQSNGTILSENDNPRTRMSKIGFDVSQQIPNIGNNQDHNWAFGMDEMVDDISSEKIDKNHKMIDNNNFIEDENFPKPKEVETKYITASELNQKLDDYDNEVESADIDTYFLFIKGELITTGSLDDIQELAFQLVIGEHEICENGPIPIKELSVLKKVKIKMGLFLE